MSHTVDRDLLLQILSGLPEFILIVDRDGMIRYINHVEPGYDPEEVVGMKSSEVLFPDSREVLDEALDRVFEDGTVAPYEVHASHPDGTDSWYAGEITPLKDGEEVVGAVIRAESVTELKAVQEELVQVKRLLPMCAWCGRIQREDGDWEGIGSYLKRVDDTRVSHGMCPECEEMEMNRAEGA